MFIAEAHQSEVKSPCTTESAILALRLAQGSGRQLNVIRSCNIPFFFFSCVGSFIYSFLKKKGLLLSNVFCGCFSSLLLDFSVCSLPFVQFVCIVTTKKKEPFENTPPPIQCHALLGSSMRDVN